MRSEQRPTVVLLHSSASSARQWEGLTEVLRPRFRVHALDFYGHGKQGAWSAERPLTLADEAAAVAALMAETGGAHVVGHSYGGAVALKLATQYPGLVRSVAVYEPVMFRWLVENAVRHAALHEVVEVANFMRAALARCDEHAAAKRFVDFWSGSDSWEALPGNTKCGIATRISAVLLHFDALFCEPLPRTQLALLKMPMLFITGAQTVAVMRGLSELFRRTFPAAQHEVLQAMGHMGPMTHATKVNRLLAGFLQAEALSELDLELFSEAA